MTNERLVADVYKEFKVDLTAQRTTLNRIHMNQMLSLPFWSSLPTSGESLRFCQIMRDRRRDQFHVSPAELMKLESWAADGDQPILLFDSLSPMMARAFTLDLIELTTSNSLPSIWALRYANYCDKRIVIADVLRMLVLQTMQSPKHSNELLESSFPVGVEQLNEAASDKDWIAILKRLMMDGAQSFIVLMLT